ncbi:Similar to LdOrf-130: Envelope fusion protein (Lymantria dispar multicapsid nuclear polyhedrosis virus) [Cotesia congregata]|uniref:Similar to LdOrf-130: Envelope fusion protein (Lymantria dispar multicapsid nuclear polyhedrosis virus) n=1 Tax=Cotesia congregata TaxID=51543 RepID=A0A8J2HNS1_COTCN|nr:Similar to LdOrf-130: Envelope fusion protein (Lymantria dispar multicapsid nuclear polyhedrosis virus) [Cotesia congregata]
MESLIRYLHEAVIAIEETQNGNIPGEILLPEQLATAIKDISRQYPELNPPQPVELTNVHALNAVAETKTGKIKEKFLIIITLPLFNQSTFKILKMKLMPVPQIIGGEARSMAIQPQKQYLAINALKDQYYLADEEDIKNCRKIGTDLACEPDEPFRKVDKSEECELLLYLQPGLVTPSTCDVRVFPKCSTTIIKLHQPNVWAYSI